MPYMTRIPSDLARFGLTVELVPGWEERGSSSFAPAGVTCHWTAGPRDSSSRPSLNVCVEGHGSLPGPLCNVYFDRRGVCVVVAAGRANHAGKGGFRGLVGNSSVYGIEAECGGDGDWTPEQIANYPRLVAALLYGLDRDASWAHGHNEWAPDRKIDIRDIIEDVRDGAASVLADPDREEEDDMNADDREFVKKVVEQITAIRRDQIAQHITGQIALLHNEMPDVDEAALAAMLAPLLVARTRSLSQEDLDAMAEAVADEQARRQAA